MHCIYANLKPLTNFMVEMKSCNQDCYLTATKSYITSMFKNSLFSTSFTYSRYAHWQDHRVGLQMFYWGLPFSSKRIRLHYSSHWYEQLLQNQNSYTKYALKIYWNLQQTCKLSCAMNPRSNWTCTCENQAASGPAEYQTDRLSIRVTNSSNSCRKSRRFV